MQATCNHLTAHATRMQPPSGRIDFLAENRSAQEISIVGRSIFTHKSNSAPPILYVKIKATPPRCTCNRSATRGHVSGFPLENAENLKSAGGRVSGFLWKMSKIRNLPGAVSLVFVWKMSKIRNLPGAYSNSRGLIRILGGLF